MADHYTMTDEGELQKLRDGLRVMEGFVERDAVPPMWLYGLVRKESFLVIAGEDSLRDSADEDESEPEPKIADMAVAIPASFDNLYHLLGSGIILDGEFAYYPAGMECVRRSHFVRRTAKVKASWFEALALSDSDAWLPEFLERHRGPTALAIARNRESGGQP